MFCTLTLPDHGKAAELWDHRSLILMLLDGGRWHAYRLPKASHCYDGAHGWNTEWPRIRDIGEEALLMTMHGSFWRFPRTFSVANSFGLAPRSTYLKVIGDFCLVRLLLCAVGLGLGLGPLGLMAPGVQLDPAVALTNAISVGSWGAPGLNGW